MSRDAWNACRRPVQGGHYESWFLRANHPALPRAFWVRYTLFVANDGRPPLGELWFIYFDRQAGRALARKLEVPIAQCRFDNARLDASVATATLDNTQLCGEIDDVGWQLRYEGHETPLLLLPRALYARRFPKAKSVVPLPLATFWGTLRIGEETIDVDGWRGSQNHNWGSRHTDRYAWCQVAGFDEAPEAFFECATAKVKLGPVWTPWVTLAVVRLDGETFAVNDLLRGARASARVGPGEWSFETRRGGLRIRARVTAAPEDFVALRYYNPPGGSKTCLNSKTAACEVELERNGVVRRLQTAHRAAFELLVDPQETTGHTPVV